MIFRITHRPHVAKPLPPYMEASLERLRSPWTAMLQAREAACRACVGDDGWFDPKWPRCTHPHCGCPLKGSGVNPWLRLRRCPADRWPLPGAAAAAPAS